MTTPPPGSGPIETWPSNRCDCCGQTNCQDYDCGRCRASHMRQAEQRSQQALSDRHNRLLQSLTPLCPCSATGDGPEQDCPIHGDGKLFAQTVLSDREKTQRLREMLGRLIQNDEVAWAGKTMHQDDLDEILDGIADGDVWTDEKQAQLRQLRKERGLQR